MRSSGESTPAGSSPPAGAAPEPLYITEMTEYVSVAFHRFLDSDSDDPSEFLAKAREEVATRVYARRR